MLQLDKKYTRTSPDGIISDVHISSQAYLEYHRDLEKHGFEYKEKYTIHNRLEECESCSA